MALDPQITANAGLYYCCYKLSMLGWTAMPLPTTRNPGARGIDVVAYSRDGTRYCGVQVRSLSRKRTSVPLGQSLDKVKADYWIVVNQLASKPPTAYILLAAEIRDLAHRGEKDGRISYWLRPKAYDQEAYREAWLRIGRG